MKRFEFHYTPKKGSWLNMAELELSAISRQCLRGRRINKIEILRQEIEALIKKRNTLAVKVNWQFTVEKARDKLKRHYEKVMSKN